MWSTDSYLFTPIIVKLDLIKTNVGVHKISSMRVLGNDMVMVTIDYLHKTPSSFLKDDK